MPLDIYSAKERISRAAGGGEAAHWGPSRDPDQSEAGGTGLGSRLGPVGRALRGRVPRTACTAQFALALADDRRLTVRHGSGTLRRARALSNFALRCFSDMVICGDPQ